MEAKKEPSGIDAESLRPQLPLPWSNRVVIRGMSANPGPYVDWRKIKFCGKVSCVVLVGLIIMELAVLFSIYANSKLHNHRHMHLSHLHLPFLWTSADHDLIDRLTRTWMQHHSPKFFDEVIGRATTTPSTVLQLQRFNKLLEKLSHELKPEDPWLLHHTDLRTDPTVASEDEGKIHQKLSPTLANAFCRFRDAADRLALHLRTTSFLMRRTEDQLRTLHSHLKFALLTDPPNNGSTDNKKRLEKSFHILDSTLQPSNLEESFVHECNIHKMLLELSRMIFDFGPHHFLMSPQPNMPPIDKMRELMYCLRELRKNSGIHSGHPLLIHMKISHIGGIPRQTHSSFLFNSLLPSSSPPSTSNSTSNASTDTPLPSPRTPMPLKSNLWGKHHFRHYYRPSFFWPRLFNPFRPFLSAFSRRHHYSIASTSHPSSTPYPSSSYSPPSSRSTLPSSRSTLLSSRSTLPSSRSTLPSSRKSNLSSTEPLPSSSTTFSPSGPSDVLVTSSNLTLAVTNGTSSGQLRRRRRGVVQRDDAEDLIQEEEVDPNVVQREDPESVHLDHDAEAGITEREGAYAVTGEKRDDPGPGMVKDKADDESDDEEEAQSTASMWKRNAEVKRDEMDNMMKRDDVAEDTKRDQASNLMKRDDVADYMKREETENMMKSEEGNNVMKKDDVAGDAKRDEIDDVKREETEDMIKREKENSMKRDGTENMNKDATDQTNRATEGNIRKRSVTKTTPTSAAEPRTTTDNAKRDATENVKRDATENMKRDGRENMKRDAADQTQATSGFLWKRDETSKATGENMKKRRVTETPTTAATEKPSSASTTAETVTASSPLSSTTEAHSLQKRVVIHDEHHPSEQRRGHIIEHHHGHHHGHHRRKLGRRSDSFQIDENLGPTVGEHLEARDKAADADAPKASANEPALDAGSPLDTVPRGTSPLYRVPQPRSSSGPVPRAPTPLDLALRSLSPLNPVPKNSDDAAADSPKPQRRRTQREFQVYHKTPAPPQKGAEDSYAKSAALNLKSLSSKAVPPFQDQTFTEPQRQMESQLQMAAQRPTDAQRQLESQLQMAAQRPTDPQRQMESQLQMAAQRPTNAQRQMESELQMAAQRPTDRQRQMESEHSNQESVPDVGGALAPKSPLMPSGWNAEQEQAVQASDRKRAHCARIDDNLILSTAAQDAFLEIIVIPFASQASPEWTLTPPGKMLKTRRISSGLPTEKLGFPQMNGRPLQDQRSSPWSSQGFRDTNTMVRRHGANAICPMVFDCGCKEMEGYLAVLVLMMLVVLCCLYCLLCLVFCLPLMQPPDAKWECGPIDVPCDCVYCGPTRNNGKKMEAGQDEKSVTSLGSGACDVCRKDFASQASILSARTIWTSVILPRLLKKTAETFGRTEGGQESRLLIKPSHSSASSDLVQVEDSSPEAAHSSPVPPEVLRASSPLKRKLEEAQNQWFRSRLKETTGTG
ncbi:unnamed protein product [Cyprideis torosa]|uniref:Uncharacterized protein n=1 Tax=Cyprideis torosa TaxID=163714 RepID=A0A7R8W1V6_9CRUS|nr:unnamed protein product [Cyprideis torosa]CAG0881356.1 unnamed protein product [Cyprideis torosa]